MDLADTGKQGQEQGNSEGATSTVLLLDFKGGTTPGLINGLARAWQFLTSEEIHTNQQGRARCSVQHNDQRPGALLVHGQTGWVL